MVTVEIPSTLSFYQKTLVVYILRYCMSPVFSYSDDDWKYFCEFYSVDYNFIKPYLNMDDSLIIYVKCGNYSIDTFYRFEESGIIDDLFRYFFTLKYLDEIKIDNSKESINPNIELYRYISHNITITNANISTRECVEKGFFDIGFAPQTEAISNINAIFKMLGLIDLTYAENKDMLENLYHAYNNDIATRMDMMMIILSLQVIKFSPFITQEQYGVCEGLIRALMEILRNAKVIAIFKNPQYFNAELEWMNRGAIDQTTRFQILYQYNNGDQYSLRLDFAHKGMEVFHLNNISKGGVDFFPLPKEEFFKIVLLNNCYAEWFINYKNDFYFIRENRKQEIYKHSELLEILNRNSHFSIPEFENEQTMISVLTMWDNVLNSVGKWMSDLKIDPVKYYRLQYIYEFVEEYYCVRQFRLNENKFKESLIDYFNKTNMFNGEKIPSELSISDILYLAICELKS